VASPGPLDDVRRPDENAPSRECLVASDADSTTANVAAFLSTVPTDARAQPCSLDLSHYPENPSLLASIALLITKAHSHLSGVIRAPPLPYFPTCWRTAMESSRQYQIPSTPRVISPSPTPSEVGSGKDGYFGPVTRSSTRKNKQSSIQSPPPIDEDASSSDPDKRARAKSRSPIFESGGIGSRRRMSGLTSRRQMNGSTKSLELTQNGTLNGHLSPAQANKNYWREMSRSPSPLGLIPIHQKWRSFVRSHSPTTKRP
jgi:diacylglycerol kinase (CTP)